MPRVRPPSRDAKALRALSIFDRLDVQHPNADTELHYRTPYELLVATILSAQSTDARVNLVTPALFARYPDARTLARAEPEELEPQIHATGFFRAKSRSLVGMARAVVAEHSGEIPASAAKPRTSCWATHSACPDSPLTGTCCASPTASAWLAATMPSTSSRN